AWIKAPERRLRSIGHLPGSDGAGPFPQGQNPPLYYAYETLPYWAVGGSFFDRVYAMRTWSVVLLLVPTTCAWLLAGGVFGRGRGAGAGGRVRPCGGVVAPASRWRTPSGHRAGRRAGLVRARGGRVDRHRNSPRPPDHQPAEGAFGNDAPDAHLAAHRSRVR